MMTSTADEKPSRLQFDLSEQEEQIVRLLDMVSPNSTPSFKEACFLMSGSIPFDSASHWVSHNLREIESAIRSIAIPRGFKKIRKTYEGTYLKSLGLFVIQAEDKKQGHKTEIKEVVKSFGLDDESDLYKSWIRLTDLAQKAHRESLGPPRQITTIFRQFWGDYLELLEHLLRQVVANMSNNIEIAEEFLKIEDPSKKDIKFFRNKFVRSVHSQSDFFQRLNHPGWLVKLENEGYFDKSIEEFHHPSNSNYLWPPYLFLKKMAPILDCQEIISAICLRTQTNNQALANQLTEVVLELPLETQVEFSKKCIDWLDSVQKWNHPIEFRNLLTSLSNGNKFEEAVSLSKALLKLSPPEDESPEESGFKFPDKPESKIDMHNYEEVIKEVLKSDLASDLEILKLLCGLLEQSIEISLTKPEEQGNDDLSEIWRSAIEDHSQNHGRYSPKDILVEAVRDIVESLLKTNKATLEEILKVLGAHHWKVFNRISLYSIKTQLPTSLDQAKSFLLDFDYWDQNANLHEFYELAGETFPLLTDEEQQSILDWINKGITKKQAEKLLLDKKQKATPKKIERAIKSWKRTRYYPIKESLPKELSELVSTIDKELGGPIKHPGFRSYNSGGSWGPKSPLTVEQLNEMSGDEVFEFLLSWVPKSDDVVMGPSPEGLNRSLVASIEATGFEKYSPLIGDLIKLNPTYVRGFILGFSKTVGKRTEKEWGEILELSSEIISNPPAFKEIAKRPFGADSDWAWAYSAIVELIGSGLKSEENSPPLKFRKQFWSIISELVDYPDAKKDEDDSGENIDHIGTAINSVSGKAFEAVIRYGHWVLSKSKIKKGKERIELIPEVAETLENHLDSENEKRLAIHSLYGEWLDWLVWFDKKWFKKITNKIFPSDDRDKFNAAWSTYVSYRGPRKIILELIEDVYSDAITHLDDTSDTDDHAVDHLVRHLMIYYWRGDLSLDSDLLKQFFSKANSKLRMRALEVLGRFLGDSQSEFNDEIKNRMKQLWELRKKVADPVELEGFGGWFASERFEDSWIVNELVGVLEISKRVEPDHRVMDKLAELVGSYPIEVLKAASFMVDGVREYWDISGWGRELDIILDEVKNSEDDGVIRLKRELISKLYAEGHGSYREYLVGETTASEGKK